MLTATGRLKAFEGFVWDSAAGMNRDWELVPCERLDHTRKSRMGTSEAIVSPAIVTVVGSQCGC